MQLFGEDAPAEESTPVESSQDVQQLKPKILLSTPSIQAEIGKYLHDGHISEFHQSCMVVFTG